MQFTQREWLSRWGRWKIVPIALGLGILLGFLGPFGSNPAYPTATRYAFWLGLTAVGVAIAIAADAVLPSPKLSGGAKRIAAVALMSAVPMTFVVAWTIAYLRPGRFFGPEQLPSLFAACAAIQLLIAYVLARTLPPGGVAPEVVAASPLPEPQRPAAAYPASLLGRLPPQIGRDIVALETEDHYLRVHAVGGNALVLMRMADAVALLDPRLGMQVHRRWWVAQNAVAGMRIDGQRLHLRLADGRLVPVGRTFAVVARARFCGSGSPTDPAPQGPSD